LKDAHEKKKYLFPDWEEGWEGVEFVEYGI
jgi:hypothetical protein